MPSPRSVDDPTRKTSQRNPWTKERRNERGRYNISLLRKVVLLGYGGKCTCCNETEFKFLNIDHVNGVVDAKADRKLGGGNYMMYRKIINEQFPSRYRILCYNCNMSRGRYGICPHEEGRQLIAHAELQFSEDAMEVK